MKTKLISYFLIVYFLVFLISLIIVHAQPAPITRIEYKLVSDSSLKVLAVKPNKVFSRELRANDDRLFYVDVDTFASVPMILKGVVVPKYIFGTIDNDKATHVGAWTKAVNVSGWFNGTLSFSNIKGNILSAEFVGDHIEYVAEKFDTHGKVGITIDQSPEVVIDLYSSTRKLNEIIYSKSLPYGNHFIKLRVTGDKNTAAKNTQVVVDYFRVRMHNE